MNLSEIGRDAEISYINVFANNSQTVERAAQIFGGCDQGLVGIVWCELERNGKSRRNQFMLRFYVYTLYVFVYSRQTVECAAQIFGLCDQGVVGNVWSEFERYRKRRRN